MITVEQLRAIMPNAVEADKAVFRVNETLNEFNITTTLRLTAFLAQLAHESGEFRYKEEVASGRAYEGRKDLGNVEPGDGKRFKGRGDIQLSGRSNYRSAGQYFGVDFEQNPELVATEAYRTRVAGWFWATRKLNDLADKEDFNAITKRINGGYNGLKDRLKYYRRALNVLGKPAPVTEATIMPVPLLGTILTAALPELIKAAPRLSEIFSSKNKSVPEKNIEAVTQVLEIAQNITGGVNAQDTVERLSADPEAQMAFKQAVQDNWHELTLIGVPDQEAIASAHKRNIEVAEKGYMMRNPAFWFTIAILPLVYMVVHSALYTNNLSKDLQSAVIGAIMTLGFAAAIQYWLGSSHGSAKKDDRKRAGDSDGTFRS